MVQHGLNFEPQLRVRSADHSKTTQEPLRVHLRTTRPFGLLARGPLEDHVMDSMDKEAGAVMRRSFRPRLIALHYYCFCTTDLRVHLRQQLRDKSRITRDQLDKRVDEPQSSWTPHTPQPSDDLFVMNTQTLKRSFPLASLSSCLLSDTRPPLFITRTFHVASGRCSQPTAACKNFVRGLMLITHAWSTMHVLLCGKSPRPFLDKLVKVHEHKPCEQEPPRRPFFLYARPPKVQEFDLGSR